MELTKEQLTRLAKDLIALQKRLVKFTLQNTEQLSQDQFTAIDQFCKKIGNTADEISDQVIDETLNGLTEANKTLRDETQALNDFLQTLKDIDEIVTIGAAILNFGAKLAEIVATQQWGQIPGAVTDLVDNVKEATKKKDNT